MSVFDTVAQICGIIITPWLIWKLWKNQLDALDKGLISIALVVAALASLDLILKRIS